MSNNCTPFAQNIPLGLHSGSDIGVHKFRFLPPGKAQVNGGVVGIGDIMPDAFVFDAAYTDHRTGNQLQNPVKVMGTPVIENAARDRLVRVPVVTGVGVTTNEGLDVEDGADGSTFQHLLDCQVVRVPTPALVDGQGTLLFLRKLNHDIGFGSG